MCSRFRKIEIWGTYPPPIGGVSIHVSRLIRRLWDINKSIRLKNIGNSKPNLPYVKNVKNVPWEFVKLLFVSPKIIHLHSNNAVVFLLFVLFGQRHKIGVTIHNTSLIKESSKWKLMIVRMFFKHTAFIILNDPNYMIQLADAYHVEKEKLFVLPAFIPPLPEEVKGLKQGILDFRKQHTFLLSANASKLRINEGCDVYGFDLLIRVVKSLREQDIDAGLIFCLPMVGDIDYYQSCLSQIEDFNISDHIMIVQEELANGFEVWELSDLFIRPTSTDIEGISVKEALCGGTPAIASDVCTRPREALLFKNRDFEDLLNKVLYVYNNRESMFVKVTSFSENVIEEILDIYKNMM